MARTWKQPVRIGPHGGASWLPEDRPDLSLRQAIAFSLVPGDTRHPWDRKEGRVAPGGAYRIGQSVGGLIAFIVRRFAELERQRRARLIGRPVVTGPDDSGARRITVVYQDLETGERDSVEVTS